MLRISSQAFRILVARLFLPGSFIYALSRYHLPCGRGFSTRGTGEKDMRLELWYFLPVRVQYKCNDKATEHEGSTAGSNQMNPFHYLLHLSDIGIDIRGSRIAVFSKYSLDRKSTVTIAVNFMDGRWSRAALEPKKRIKEAWDFKGEQDIPNGPFDVHCVYFTSALRWWTNALNSVNEQLMAYVSLSSRSPWSFNPSCVHILSNMHHRNGDCTKPLILMPKPIHLEFSTERFMLLQHTFKDITRNLNRSRKLGTILLRTSKSILKGWPLTVLYRENYIGLNQMTCNKLLHIWSKQKLS